MKIREEIDPEIGEKIRIFDLEIPNSSDVVTGNIWGWNKTKPKSRPFFVFLLICTLIYIAAQAISAIALLQK
ncbi:hypothetical protein IKE71_01555 [Candidatus Saccharibacteria bacterium]|nr:hypothetical protein [Candidatus Saccharibacteria bacterium]